MNYGKDREMTHKISRKNLKEDEIRTFGMNIYDYIGKNQKQLLIVAGVFVILFIGWKLYSIQKQNVMKETNLLFSQAASYFQMTLMAEKPEQKEQLTQLCLDNCNRILNDYRSSPLAINTLYLKGSVLFFKAATAKDLDEPVTLFNEFITRSTTVNDKAMGYVALGYAYENKYFLSEDRQLLNSAMSAYEKAIELGKDSAVGAEAKLCKARLLELQYKDDQAIALLNQVKQERKPQASGIAGKASDYRDPQLEFMSQQLKNMQNFLTFSQAAQFAIDRLEGQK